MDFIQASSLCVSVLALNVMNRGRWRVPRPLSIMYLHFPSNVTYIATMMGEATGVALRISKCGCNFISQ